MDGHGGGSGGLIELRPDNGEVSCCHPGVPIGDTASFISMSSRSPVTLGVVTVSGPARGLDTGDIRCVACLDCDEGDTKNC